MRERVDTIIGTIPVILVAPHGPDDINTDIIVEHVANKISCYAVINRGFDRADSVDVENNKADCNRVDHCNEDVVYDEFLKPIIRFKDRIMYKKTNDLMIPYPETVHIFYVHGCGNIVHKEAGRTVELIVGHGLGVKTDSLSCESWRRNLFVNLYKLFSQTHKTGFVYSGKGGGRYAGRHSNNINQYFRKHDLDPDVQSMQLEFPYSCRDSEASAIVTASCLAVTITDYLLIKDESEDGLTQPSPKLFI